MTTPQALALADKILAEIAERGPKWSHEKLRHVVAVRIVQGTIDAAMETSGALCDILEKASEAKRRKRFTVIDANAAENA